MAAILPFRIACFRRPNALEPSTLLGPDPGQVGGEHGRPGLAAVVGIGLGIGVRIGGNVRPRAAQQDLAALVSIGAVELANAVVERPDRRRAELAVTGAGIGLAPLAGLRIVEEDRHAVPMAVGAIGRDFFQPGAPVPDLAFGDRTVERHRVGGAVERVQDARDVGMPSAEVEVEIVGAVTYDRRLPRRVRGGEGQYQAGQASKDLT